MTPKTRSILRVFSLCLLLLFLINMFPLQSLAAEDMFEGEIELTGSYNGRFSLDSSDMKMFNLKNIVPGDTWNGKLHVKNKGKDIMEFSIISIVSNLQDETLYDALDLKISYKDQEIYNGSYGATGMPISDMFSISAGKTITFDLVVSLPKTAGNNIQNKEMDSTWTFEARYYGSSGGGGTSKPIKKRADYTVHYVDEDGNDLLNKKTGTGYVGTAVIEYAPTIDGYTPDTTRKCIVLQKDGENKIVFVYSLSKEEPPVPSEPTPGPVNPDDPDDPAPTDKPTNPDEPTPPGEEPTDDPSVQTGYDKTDSNSMVAGWLVIFGLCMAAGIVLYFRINAEKKRVKNQKSNSKEDKVDVKAEQ